MEISRQNLLRTLPVLALVCGCQASGWSLSMNSDTLTPAIGIRTGGDTRDGQQAPIARRSPLAVPRRVETESELAAASTTDEPRGDNAKPEAPVASRSRFANWLSQRTRRRSPPDRIPLPITEQTAVETASHSPTDDF